MTGRWLGAPGLLRRYAVALRGVLALVGVVVVALAFFATIAPAALSNLLTDAQRHAISEIAPRDRDISDEEQVTPPRALSDRSWSGLHNRLAAARDTMEPLLRSLTDPGTFTVTSVPRYVGALRPLGILQDMVVNTSLSPDLDRHVRMVEGELPARPKSARAPADLIISQAVAEEMRWKVGEERIVSGGTLPDRRYRLSGIYEPADPDDAFWSHTSAAITPVIKDDGESRVVTATAWVASDGLDALGVSPYDAESRTTLWFPFHPERATSAQAPELIDALATFTRTSVPLAEGGMLNKGDVSYYVDAVRASFATETTGVLRESQVTATSLIALTSLLAAGPAAAALCVLVLATGLVRARSVQLLTLVRARGASRAMVAGGAAVVGLLVGIPAATLGAAVAVLFAPGGASVSWWPAIVCAVLPALTMVGTAAAAQERRARLPRSAVELVLVVATAASLVAVAQRGSGNPGAAVDPLLIAAPVLVCLTAAAVALRILPIVAAGVAAWQRRRTGLVGLLAASRTRADITSPVAVVALVAAIGVAVAAGAAVATLENGRDQTAQSLAGADLRVSGESIDNTAVRELGELPYVREVATFSDGAGVPMRADTFTYVTRVLTDATALSEVQESISGGLPALDELAGDGGGAAGEADRVPVIVSKRVADQLDGEKDIVVSRVEARVVAVVPDRLPGVDAADWVLFDREALGDAAPHYDPPISALAALDRPADEDIVGEVAALFPRAEVTAPFLEEEVLAEDPAASGVTTIAWVATLTAAILVGATVILALVGGAASRGRDVAVVRALGLPSRRVRRIPVWEVGILVAVSGGVAAAVGAVIPYAVFGAVDLAPLTGGAAQPSVTIPAAWWGFVGIGLVVVAGAGAIVAAKGAGRRELTDVLRTMEE